MQVLMFLKLITYINLGPGEYCNRDSDCAPHPRLFRVCCNASPWCITQYPETICVPERFCNRKCPFRKRDPTEPREESMGRKKFIASLKLEGFWIELKEKL